MNFVFKPNFLISSVILISLILITGCTPECTTINYVNTSIEIESGNLTHIGLNTNRDSLNFGKVSPGAVVERSINVEYSKPAQVKVTAEGDFSSWINIIPAEFFLSSPKTNQEMNSEITLETKLIYFTVIVPEQALIKKYSGKIKFCFQE